MPNLRAGAAMEQSPDECPPQWVYDWYRKGKSSEEVFTELMRQAEQKTHVSVSGCHD